MEGKTTLLKIAAGIESLDEGEVWLGEMELTNASDRERARLLGTEIAWIPPRGHGREVQGARLRRAATGDRPPPWPATGA